MTDPDEALGPQLRASFDEAGDPAVLALAGEVGVESCDALEERLGGLISSRPAVVVDLGQVRFIDSSGLAVFIHAREAAEQHGARLVLRGLSGPVARLFSLSDMKGRFEVEPR